jgi:hypothetical protein
MLSIDTRPSTAGYDPTDGGLTIPAFRRELGNIAPHLVDKFDSINDTKNEKIEEYGRRYHQAKAGLFKRHATSSSHGSERRENSITKDSRPGSGSTDEPSLRGFDNNPSTNTDATSSLTGHPHAQAEARGNDRIALSNTTRISNDTCSVASSANLKASTSATTNEKLLTTRILIRLLPVVQLLTGSDLTPAQRLQAQELAHAVLHYANECNASHPLVARCSFYIAHTHYDHDDHTTTQTAINWFERATEASEAGYPEGQWAQEWLNRYESVNMAAESRPGTASSWVSSKLGGVWNVLSWSKSSAASTSPKSPSAAKSRPTSSLWRMHSGDGTRATPQRRTMGERIPSFSTANTTSISPSSRPNSGTREQYSPWDKSDTSPNRRFDFQSTEPIHEENEDQAEEEEEEEEEEEQHIPNNVLGGLVPAGALSPAMQRSPPAQQQHHQLSRRSSDAYIPHAQRYRIANLTSPPDSPSSPGSSKKQSPISSSYFTHSRAQSFANDSPSSPVSLPISSHIYAQSEGSPNSRNKKRNSLSHLLISATGFSGAGWRDEAAQMEEGQSPAFVPTREEEGLYQRRSHDVVEEEV